MNKAKVLIRGASGSGKSSLLNQALAECGIQPRGLRTLRSFQDGKEQGFDMLALSTGTCVPLVRGLPRQPKRPDHAFFDAFALPMLRGELAGDGLILVDEIGRFEKHEDNYLKALLEVWHDSARPSLFVLKKEHLPFNDMLWDSAVEQALTIDLEESTPLEAGQSLCGALMDAPAPRVFLRVILDTSGMESAEALRLLDRVCQWLNSHSGKGLGILCDERAEMLHTAAGRGLVPVHANNCEDGLSLPLFRQYQEVRDLVLTARSLQLRDAQWLALLADALRQKEQPSSADS